MTGQFRTQSDVSTRVDGYFGGLALTLPFMPTFAGVVSVVAYVLLPAKTASAGPQLESAPGDPVVAVWAGLIVAAVTWLALALPARAIAAAGSTNPEFYSELRVRCRLLRDRLAAVTTASRAISPGAYLEVGDLLDTAEYELGPARSGPAMRWALGYGYMNVLRQLHRASEILILLETGEAVVGDALNDELSLEGSTIQGSDRLRAILRSAVNGLSPVAATTFLPALPGSEPTAVRLTNLEAREAIREVDHAVKKFRDERRDGLIRARNNLIWTMLAVALPAYLLLGLAMIGGSPRIHVVSASAFFLVGAMVGLFQRLDAQSKTDTAIEDFGLYQARLIAAPLLSGVAAVGGVLLITAVPALATGDTGGELAATLAAAFDVRLAPIGLAYAAIFGLTPGLLTGRLDEQARKLTEDLSASTPSTGSTT